MTADQRQIRVTVFVVAVVVGDLTYQVSQKEVESERLLYNPKKEKEKEKEGYNADGRRDPGSFRTSTCE